MTACSLQPSGETNVGHFVPTDFDWPGKSKMDSHLFEDSPQQNISLPVERFLGGEVCGIHKKGIRGKNGNTVFVLANSIISHHALVEVYSNRITP